MPFSAKRVISPACHQHRLPPPAKTVFLNGSSRKDKPTEKPPKGGILFAHQQKSILFGEGGVGFTAKSGWLLAKAAARTGVDGAAKSFYPPALK